MMTWTSEMSGRASRGIRFRDQIPDNTSPATAIKTKKRFALHQSITRSIIASSHRHRAGHRRVKLLIGEWLAILASSDSNKPSATALQIDIPRVRAVALISQ